MTTCEWCGGNVKVVNSGRGIGTCYYVPENKPIPHKTTHGKMVGYEDCKRANCELGINVCGLCGGLDLRTKSVLIGAHIEEKRGKE